MNEVNIIPPEGYVIDEQNSSFTCIKFKKKKKKEVTCWEDLQEIKGYYVREDSVILEADVDTEDHNKNLFATKEQAKACIALAMLSQLKKNVNGDWIPDWEDSTEKYMIYFGNNKIQYDYCYSNQCFLAFPTEEIRDTFLNNHEELIMKAKSLL